MNDAQYQQWLESDIGRYCVSYIQSGFAVFPVHGIKDGICTCGKLDCTNVGKHPACAHGFKAALKEIEGVAKLFSYRTDYNIGIACGDISDMLVLDIDPAKGGSESLLKLEKMLGDLPQCPTVHTGGNGLHLVFKNPEKKIPTRKDAFGKEFPGLDIRGTGGYVVWPPSLHKSGKRYEFAPGFYEMDFPEMPIAWQEKASASHAKPKEFIRPVSIDAQSEWTSDDISKMLAHLEPDMGYDEWIAVGMAIHHEGMPFDLWDNWSAKGAKYRGPADLAAHWKSFRGNGERTIGTLIEWATLHGWKPEARRLRESDPLALERVAPLMRLIEEKTKPVMEMPALPENALGFDTLTLPGPIGDTVRWITKHAIYEQPELALLNVLAFAGAVFGRRYCSPVNTRTNLYLVGTSYTGSGKESSVRAIEILALASNTINFLGSNNIRSDTGLLKNLSQKSSQLLMIDEFGMFMRAMGDKNASAYTKGIIATITKLYSKSSGLYDHGDTADAKNAIRIVAPNLCIYGTTTQETYVESLRKSAIVTGELNRFIVIPSGRAPVPRRHIEMPVVPDGLAGWWGQFTPGFGSQLGSIMDNGMGVPTPKVIEWGECDELQYTINCEQARICGGKSETRYLWSRLYENTIKIAMLFAIARDPVNPSLKTIDFDYAGRIVRASIDYMTSIAQHGMADTQKESNHLEVLRAVKEAGRMPRKEMLRRFRKLNKRELDEIIISLVDEGEIMVQRSESGKGRPAEFYCVPEKMAA